MEGKDNLCKMLRKRKKPCFKVRRPQSNGKMRKVTLRISPTPAKTRSRGPVEESHPPMVGVETVSSTTLLTNENLMTTSYQQSCTRLQQAWSDVRNIMCNMYTKVTNVPLSSTCIKCKKEVTDIIWCKDCSYTSYFCLKCSDEVHEYQVLHAPLRWVSQHSSYAELGGGTLDKFPESHQCTTIRFTYVTIIDISGRHHSRQIPLCDCEEAVATFVRYGLWPASPKSPQVAFTLQCMEMLRVLMMECQISVSGFAAVLNILGAQSDLPLKLVNDIGKSLSRETFEEYRFFSYNLRYPQNDGVHLDDGTVCPVCPKNEEFKAMFSIDANFGLVRKVSAGVSNLSPKHGSRFFINQDEVNEYVDQYSGDNVLAEQDCSDFKAGNMLRSKGRTAKLSEKGIFGSVCRHEFPQKFLSLMHGERLAYAVKLLEEITTDRKSKCNILYDIACMLEKHLKKKNNSSLLEKIDLGIPVFHAYGHKAACQVLYNPRKLQSFGLTDGEAIERLWSFLRRFSRITKEMTASHRQDLLVDALLHYGERLKSRFAKTLTTKMEKAEATFNHYQNELGSVCEMLPGQISEEVLTVWSENLRDEYSRKQSSQVKYGSKEQVLDEIRKVSSERLYLINLKRNYSNGQAIANRLAKQITKCTNHVSRLVRRYNNVESEHKITLQDALDIKSCLGESQGNDEQHFEIAPRELKLKALDAFHMMCRAREEMSLVKEEMRSTVQHYIGEHTKAIVNRVDCLSKGDTTGCALWQNFALKIELILDRMSAFHQYVLDLGEMPTQICQLVYGEQRNAIQSLTEGSDEDVTSSSDSEIESEDEQ